MGLSVALLELLIRQPDRRLIPEAIAFAETVRADDIGGCSLGARRGVHR